MYKEQVIDGKGIGCIAIEMINKGTLILREDPAFVLPSTAKDDETKDDYLELIMNSYKGMSIENQIEYMNLTNAYDRKDTQLSEMARMFSQTMNQQLQTLKLCNITEEEVTRIWQIVATNRFHNGVFLKMSRFNHACNANAEYFWNFDIEKRDMRAIRNIEEGEEITVSYLDSNYLTRQERQEILRENYLFDCTCEACNKMEDEIDEETTKCEEFKNEKAKQKKLEELGCMSTAQINNVKTEVACIKKMHQIAKDINLIKIREIEVLLEDGFNAACQGFLLAEDYQRKVGFSLPPLSLSEMKEQFMEDANKFANDGELISLRLFEETHSIPIIWKERKTNPINYFKLENQ